MTKTISTKTITNIVAARSKRVRGNIRIVRPKDRPSFGLGGSVGSLLVRFLVGPPLCCSVGRSLIFNIFFSISFLSPLVSVASGLAQFPLP